MVKGLCQHYSPALVSLPPPSGSTAAEEPYHPFPPPSALAAPEVSTQLRALGFGYRADFIQRTAAMLVETHGVTQSPKTRMEPSEEWLTTLRTLSTTEARAELLKFVGVGRKVADCILLMSLDKVGCPSLSRNTNIDTHTTEGGHTCGYTCTPDSCQTLRPQGRCQGGKHEPKVIRGSQHQAVRRLGRVCRLGALRGLDLHCEWNRFLTSF